MSSSRGFTLIETVVAVLIAATIIVAIGGLSERLVHHRTTTDSNSAAMALAERKMEVLLADTNPNPTTTQCAGGSPPSLCSGSHGPTNVDLNLAASTSGPYTVTWTIVNATTTSTSPFVQAVTGGSPTAVKKITVKVTHMHDPFVNASVVRYYKVT
jgi:prepilin-type N-terminal cleavage/methylation domain-containing protein